MLCVWLSLLNCLTFLCIGIRFSFNMAALRVLKNKLFLVRDDTGRDGIRNGTHKTGRDGMARDKQGETGRDALRDGTGWHSMGRGGTRWHGMTRDKQGGTAWDTIQHGTGQARRDALRDGPGRHNMARDKQGGTAWDTIRHGTG